MCMLRYEDSMRISFAPFGLPSAPTFHPRKVLSKSDDSFKATAHDARVTNSKKPPP